MNQAILQIRDLAVQFGTGQFPLPAVTGVSFDIARNQTLALLGESGCGKSVTALSIMRLLPPGAVQQLSGSVCFDQQELLSLPEQRMRQIRGGRIAMIFQEPMTSLNPVLTVGYQIAESLDIHTQLSAKAKQHRVIELLDQVGIADPKHRAQDFPHQLSGGMKQRVMIAMALAGEPDLLIADEPTTALDVTIQAQILSLLKQLGQQMSILLITHDLGVVADMADNVAVMYAGQIVEYAQCEDFFKKPFHPYSQKLFSSLPTWQKRESELSVIPGAVPTLQESFSGCRFQPRCDHATLLCQQNVPQWQQLNGRGIRCLRHNEITTNDRQQKPKPIAVGEQPTSDLLTVQGLTVYFPIQKGIFKRTVGYIKAVDGIDLSIDTAKTLALVGESGCGKTTAGKGIIHLLKPTSGSVYFAGDEWTTLSAKQLRNKRRDMQMVFQDPFSSMNPRMLIADIITEGLIDEKPAQRRRRAGELLQQVGLHADMGRRYPHEFSGGQRQRIAIARALAVQPKLIICDEPTSALDSSFQAQILNLLKTLQRKLGISYLFITHNIGVVAYLADELAVMYFGQIIEQGKASAVLQNPQHPYTQALLAAVPKIPPKQGHRLVELPENTHSPASPPPGCRFNPRCPKVMPICRQQAPDWSQASTHHRYRCFFQDQKQC